jgi:hypothetical protein
VSPRLDDLIRIAKDNVTRDLTDEECSVYLHADACPTTERQPEGWELGYLPFP